MIATAMVVSFDVMSQSRGGSSSENSSSSSRSSNGVTMRSSRSSGSSSRGNSSGATLRSSSSTGSSYRGGSSVANRTNTSVRTSHNSSSNEYRSTRGVANKAPVVERDAPKYKDRKYKDYPRSKSHYVARPYPRVIPRPDNHVRIHHGGYDYYYRDGLYYRFHNNRYVIAPPPRHIRVSVIPSTYFSFRIGNLAYFYSNGAYYNYDALNSVYEVVDPPMGAIVPDLPQYDVNTVVINGKTYLEYDNVLYKAIVTGTGVRYKVMGRLDGAFVDY